MSEDRVIRTLRMQAWQRAKGELEAVLNTYWDGNNNYLKMSNEVKTFIESIEDRGLQE